MKVSARRLALLVELARDIYDSYDCMWECEEKGGTLGYMRGRPCVDCCCFKCMAARALRARAGRKR